MLKTRNLIFAISLSPLLSFTWQLSSQAQSFSPSLGTAGVDAGAATGASETSGFSTPSTPTEVITAATTPAGTLVSIPIIPGVSLTITSGVSTKGDLSVGGGDAAGGGDTTTTVTPSPESVERTSPSVTVKGGETANTIVITLDPQVQATVNQEAAAIVQSVNGTTVATKAVTTGGTTDGTKAATTGGTAAPDVASLLTGGAGSQQAGLALTTSLTTAGISPQLAASLVSSLNGMVAAPNASLANQPLAQAISGQPVAETKVFRPVSVIAQGGAVPSVNITKLNDAIVAYNGIILQSEPQTLQNLSGNTVFVRIGGILKQLRSAIK